VTLTSRVRALARWFFVDPRAVWAALGIPAIALAGAHYLPWERELNVRVGGYAITLAGVLLVVADLRGKRRAFNRPGAMTRLLGWLWRLPPIFLPSRPVVANVSGNISLSVVGSGYVTTTASPGAPLHQRITVLEDNLRRANDRISNTENLIRSEVSTLQLAHSEERAGREAADQRLNSQLEELSVGGLDVAYVGVVWVVGGNALTTFPAEIARWLALHRW
jgi:hypothetical protein